MGGLSNIMTLLALAELCESGYLLDPTDGCKPCPKDEYSAAGNKAAVCIKCPEGKGVAMGAGTQESDCKWSKLIIDFPYLSHRHLSCIFLTVSNGIR